MIKKLASLLFILAGCSSNYAPLDTVDSVDVNRYLGRWHEIARLPNSFQEGCLCTTAEYSILDEETIRVVNRCVKDSLNGEEDIASGKGFIVENSNNAKLRVQFFWPFRGDYWIIELDRDQYSYAVVGTPSRKYLWILSREPSMNEELLEGIIQRCKSKGFPTDKLLLTDQGCFIE